MLAEEFSTVKQVKSQQTALELCAKPARPGRSGKAHSEAVGMGKLEWQRLPSTSQTRFVWWEAVGKVK